ncbi:MAG TPA: PQQ-dependent sugar dehydrogenase [Acidimicrobiales bacterium]|nr:PQQ-dependent sugar dehydrogenase [Acidimicrobiales bacterium]
MSRATPVARRSRARRATAALAAGALLAAACSGDDSSDNAGDGEGAAGGPSAATSTAATSANSAAADPGPGALAEVEVALTPVAEADSPTSLVLRPGSEELYVAEREGTVRRVDVSGSGADRSYELADDPLIDISDSVVADAERGLLDIAFSPEGDTLYLSYSLAPDGDTRVDAYAMADDALDTDSHQEILAVEQPYPNHNGGDIEFGPDGFLYVALGDGGAGGDPEGNGQDTSALLGKVLRLDPTPAEGGYAIPPDNPFADGDGGAPEVWLYGVRNPWRITFDPGTDDLWVADVGQEQWEEVDLLPAADGAGIGANLGWDQMEGTHQYDGGTAPDGAVAPIFEYSHDEGCSITGGVVYAGPSVPGLEGAYLFTDYCQGVLRALRATDGALAEQRVFDDATLGEPVSFGVDAVGDAYVLSLGGEIARVDPA